MAEEEKVEKVEVVEEAQPKQEPAPQGGMQEGDKHTLITFILAIVGLCLACGWIIGSIAGIVVSAIAMKRVKADQPTRNPFRVFKRISKPVSIVGLIVCIVALVLWTVFFAIGVVAAVAEALEGAEALVALF